MTAALALVPSGLARVAKVETSAEESHVRIMERLIDAEMHESNPHYATDYRQAQITIALIRRGDPIPFVTASYKIHACHPDRVFEKITLMRQAKLGREYPFWFDKNGLLRADMPIADYDPTCGVVPVLPWETDSEESELITAPPRRWPKAPARIIVSRTRVIRDDVFFYEEVLECGHTHFDYIGGWVGGNPKQRRRRCNECQNALAAEKKPVRAVSAEDVARIRIRLDAE